MIQNLINRKETVSSCLALFLSISLIFNSTVFVHPQETNNGDDNVEPTPLIEEETPDEEVVEKEERIEKSTIEDPITEDEEEIESNLIFIEEIIEEIDEEKNFHVEPSFESCVGGVVGISVTTRLVIVPNRNHQFVQNGNKVEVRLKPPFVAYYGNIVLPQTSLTITRIENGNIVHTVGYSPDLPCTEKLSTFVNFEFNRGFRPVYDVKNSGETSNTALKCKIDDSLSPTYFEGNAVCVREQIFVEQAHNRPSDFFTNTFSIPDGTFANPRPNFPPIAKISNVNALIVSTPDETTITSAPHPRTGPINFNIDIIDNIEIENPDHRDRDNNRFFIQQQDPITDTALLISPNECASSAKNSNGRAFTHLSDFLSSTDYQKIQGKTADEIKALFSDYDFELVKNGPQSYAFSEIADDLFFCLWATDGRAGFVSLIETKYDNDGPVIIEQPSYNQDGPFSDSVIKLDEIDATGDLIDFAKDSDWIEDTATDVYYEVVDFGSTCDETNRGRVTALNTFYEDDNPVAGANRASIFKSNGIFSGLTNNFTENLVNQKFCFYLIDFFSNITTAETQTPFSLLPIADTTSPTVTSVVFERVSDSPLARSNKYAKQGDTVEITINFSEPLKTIGRSFPSQSNSGEFLFGTESQITGSPTNHYYPVSQFNFEEIAIPTEDAPRNNAIYRITVPFNENQATGSQKIELFRLSAETKDLSDNSLPLTTIRSTEGTKSKQGGVKDGIFYFDSRPTSGNIDDITIVEPTDPTKSLSTDGTLINYGDPTFNITGLPNGNRVQLRVFKFAGSNPFTEVIANENGEISLLRELTEESVYTLKYKLVDNAGNTGSEKLFTFTLDLLPPEESIQPSFVIPFDTESDDGVDNNTRGRNTLGYINKEQLDNVNNDRTRIINPPTNRTVDSRLDDNLAEYGSSFSFNDNISLLDSISIEYGFAPFATGECEKFIKYESDHEFIPEANKQIDPNDADPLNFFSLAYFRSLNFADGEYKVCRKYMDGVGNSSVYSDGLILIKDTEIPIVDFLHTGESSGQNTYSITPRSESTDISFYNLKKGAPGFACDASTTFPSEKLDKSTGSITLASNEEPCLRVTDKAGNIFHTVALYAPYNFDLATDSDSHPINPANDSMYDSALSTDNITNENMLLISLRSSASSVVQLYLNGDVFDGIVESADVSGNVNFTIDASGWNDGVYIITGISTLNGVESPRTADMDGLTVVIDRTPPTTPVNAPDLKEESDTCYTAPGKTTCTFGTKNDDITTDVFPDFDVDLVPDEDVYVNFFNNDDFITTRNTNNTDAEKIPLLLAGETELFLSGSASADECVLGEDTPRVCNEEEETFALTYKYIDKAGNSSSLSPALGLIVDNRTSLAETPTLNDNSNSGSNSDNITRNNILSFTTQAVDDTNTCSFVFHDTVDTPYSGNPIFNSPLTTLDENGNPNNFCDTGGVNTIDLLKYSLITDSSINLYSRWVSLSGYISPPSSFTNITIDRETEEASISLLSDSDSGMSSSDSITSDTTPEFSITNLEERKLVTDSKPSKIVIYEWTDVNNDNNWLADESDPYSEVDAGELVISKTYDHDDASRVNLQSFIPDALSDGLYRFVVKQEDDAANIVWSSSDKVAFDENTGEKGDNVVVIDTTPIVFFLDTSYGNLNQASLEITEKLEVNDITITCDSVDSTFTIAEKNNNFIPLASSFELSPSDTYSITVTQAGFSVGFDHSNQCVITLEDVAGNLKSLTFESGLEASKGTRTFNATGDVTFTNFGRTETEYASSTGYFFDVYKGPYHVGSAGFIDTIESTTISAITTEANRVVVESSGKTSPESEIIFYAREGYTISDITGFTPKSRTEDTLVSISALANIEYTVDIGDTFFFDEIDPFITSISAAKQGETNSPDNKYANTGSTVDVTVAFNEPITTATLSDIQIGSTSISPLPTPVESDNSFVYSINIPANVNGAIEIIFSNFADRSDNSVANVSVSTVTTDNTLLDFFFVDTTLPEEGLNAPKINSNAPGFDTLNERIANINIETFNAIAEDDTTPLIEDVAPTDNSNAPIKTEYALGRNDNSDKCDLAETRNGVAVREFLSPTDFNVEHLKNVPEAQYRVCRRYTDLSGNSSEIWVGQDKVVSITKDLTFPSADIVEDSNDLDLSNGEDYIITVTDAIELSSSAKIIKPFTGETCDATTDFSTSDDLALTLSNDDKTGKATITLIETEAACVQVSDAIGNLLVIGEERIDTTADFTYSDPSFFSDRTEITATLNITEGIAESRTYDSLAESRTVVFGTATIIAPDVTSCSIDTATNIVTIEGTLPDSGDVCSIPVNIEETSEFEAATATALITVARQDVSIIAPVYRSPIVATSVPVNPTTRASVSSTGYGGTIEYSVTPDSVCSIDSSNGRVTLDGVTGVCDIVVTAPATINYKEGTDESAQIVIDRETSILTLNYSNTYRLGEITTATPSLLIEENGLHIRFGPEYNTRTVTFTEVANSDANNYCEVDTNTGVVTITANVNDDITCSVEVSIEESGTYTSATDDATVLTKRPHYTGTYTWNNENISVPLQNKDILPNTTIYTTAGQCTVDVSGDVSITGAGTCTVTIDTPTDDPVDLTIETAKGTLITTDPVYDSPIKANATSVGPTTEASTVPEYTGVITYSTSTTDVCSVDATSGAVTPEIIGTCTVTASFASDINWNTIDSSAIDITVEKAENVVVFSYQQTGHVGGTQEITPNIEINGENLITAKTSRTVTFSELGDDLDANACTVNAETGVITITGTLDSENLDCSVEVSIGSHTRYLESTHNATLQISKVAKTPTVVAFSYPLEYRLGTTTSTIPVVTIKDGDDPARTFDSVSETRTVTFTEVANSDTNNYCEIDTNTGVVTVTADVDDEVSCVFSVSVDETDSQTSVNLSTTIATSRPYYVGGSSWNNTPILVELQNKDILPVNTIYTTVGQCSVDSGGDVSITGAGTCTVTIDTPTDDPIDLTIETAKGTLIITNPAYDSPIKANATLVGPTTEASTVPEYTGVITYSTSTTDICSVDATNGAVTPKIIGTCTITASFASDINWNAIDSSAIDITVDGALNTISFTYQPTVRNSSTQTVSPTVIINSEDLATTSRTATFTEVANTDTNNYCTIDSSTGVVTIDADVSTAVTCNVEISIEENSIYAAATETAVVTTISPTYDDSHTWDGVPILVALQNGDTLPAGTTYTSKSGQCTVAASGDVSITGAGTCTITIDTKVGGVTDLTIETAKGTLSIIAPVYRSPIVATSVPVNPTTRASVSSTGYGGTIEYSVTPDSVCSIDSSNGRVTLDGVTGVCDIVVTAPATINYKEGTDESAQIVIDRETSILTLNYSNTYRLGEITTATPSLLIEENGLHIRFGPEYNTRTVTFNEVANTDTNNYCEVDTNTGVVTITANVNDDITCSVEVSIEESGTYTSATDDATVLTKRPHYTGTYTWNNENISVPLQNKDILPNTTIYTTAGQCTVDVSGDVTITGAGTCTVTIDTPTDDPVDLTIETAKGTLIITNPVYDSPILATDTATNPTTLASTPTTEYTGAITYSTSTDTICSVDATSGAVTPLLAGTCTITASFASDINWNANESAIDITVERVENVVNFTYPEIRHTDGTQTVSPSLEINDEDLATTSRTVTFTEVANTDTNNYCTVDSSTGVVTITGTITEIAVTCEVEVSIDLDGRYLASTHQATLNISGLTIDFSGNGRIDTTDAIVFYIYAIFEGIGFAPVDNQKILESVLREEVNFTIEGSPRLSDSAEDVYNLLKSYSDSNAIDFSGNGRTDTTDAIVFYIYAIFEGIGFAPIDNQKILDSVLREEVNFTIEGSPRLSDSAEDVYNLLKGYSR